METDDGANFSLEVFVEFEEVDGNAPAMATMIEAGLETLATHPRLGAFKRIWRAVEVKQDGRRVHVALDLGTSRAAVGTLTQLFAQVMLATRAVQEEGVARELRVAPKPALPPPAVPQPAVPKPAVPEPPVRPGGGGGGGK